MDKPEIGIEWDTVDWERVDQAALALMLLGVHDGRRAWKGFDWGVLNRLHEKGFITDPRSKAKSVSFTGEGIEEAQALFEQFFRRETKDE